MPTVRKLNKSDVHQHSYVNNCTAVQSDALSVFSITHVGKNKGIGAFMNTFAYILRIINEPQRVFCSVNSVKFAHNGIVAVVVLLRIFFPSRVSLSGACGAARIDRDLV